MEIIGCGEVQMETRPLERMTKVKRYVAFFPIYQAMFLITRQVEIQSLVILLVLLMCQ